MSWFALALILVPHAGAHDLLRQKMSEGLELVEQEKRSHDERLKAVHVSLARRSCDEPGSVSQSELDALARPRKKEAVDIVKRLTGTCYDRVYWMLYAGATAEDIKRVSTPILVARQPAPVPPPVDVIAGDTFESVLPKLKVFSEIACVYKGHVPPVRELFIPRAPYFFSSRDEAAAAGAMAGLDGCGRHMFRRLFDAVRNGNGGLISENWLIETAASAPAAAKPVASGATATRPGSAQALPLQIL